ncbi:MAG: beta-lactamase family protein [Roseibacillus sp.]|nr:beta-lactamase family protein [Roseibacillus sp.]
MRPFVVTIGLCCLLGGACPGKEKSATSILADLPGPETPSELDRFIMDGMREARVPGLAAAIVKGGRVSWSGAYGWANISEKRPVTKDTFFQLASVSKTVTACVVMQQVERGNLALDADINEVLPFALRNPAHPDVPITLRHLLTHTSGVRDNWDLLEDTWVKDGDFPMPLGKSLSAYLEPGGEYYSEGKNFYGWAAGSRSKYSNVGVALAALVAEVKSKTPFEELARIGVFGPLGMKGSAFLLEGMDKSRLAMPYAFKKKSGAFKALGHHGYLDFPSGLMRSSAAQMARFLLAFIGDGKFGEVRILKDDSVAAMRRVSMPKVAPGQGLAWYTERVAGTRLMGHDGSDPGVSTMMYYRPGDGTGFVFLMNAEPRGGRFEEVLARRLLEFAQGQ